MSYSRDDGFNVTGWIETYTGRMVTPMNLDHATLSVLDIAHALAQKCRYSGHTHGFYSVAEHSVLMARYARTMGDEAGARWALLHDAVEAYVPDVPRPLKPFIDNWYEIESGVERAVLLHFGLDRQPEGVKARVKSLDTRILLREAETLLRSGGKRWEIKGAPLMVRVRCWSPAVAKAEFLTLFYELFPDYSEPVIDARFDATAAPCGCEEPSPAVNEAHS